jgi:hypothetical protein
LHDSQNIKGEGAGFFAAFFIRERERMRRGEGEMKVRFAQVYAYAGATANKKQPSGCLKMLTAYN